MIKMQKKEKKFRLKSLDDRLASQSRGVMFSSLNFMLFALNLVLYFDFFLKFFFLTIKFSLCKNCLICLNDCRVENVSIINRIT